MSLNCYKPQTEASEPNEFPIPYKSSREMKELGMIYLIKMSSAAGVTREIYYITSVCASAKSFHYFYYYFILYSQTVVALSRFA